MVTIYRQIQEFFFESYPLDIKREDLIKEFSQYSSAFITKTLGRLHRGGFLTRYPDGYYRAKLRHVIKYQEACEC